VFHLSHSILVVLLVYIRCCVGLHAVYWLVCSNRLRVANDWVIIYLIKVVLVSYLLLLLTSTGYSVHLIQKLKLRREGRGGTPCVCLNFLHRIAYNHAGIVSKRLNIANNATRHPSDSGFLTLKISAKFEPVIPADRQQRLVIRRIPH